MDGIKKRPDFVVTVLRGAKPIAVIEVRRDAAQVEQVDCYYQDLAALMDARDALDSSYNGAGFVIWQEGGPVPAPPDLGASEEISEPPF